jgi:hypothetical protein
MLGVSLKSTWFLMHRIREAMREPFFGTQMGSFRKPVQADETFIGRRTSRAGEVRQRGYAEKEPVLTLVDGKQIRSFPRSGSERRDPEADPTRANRQGCNGIHRRSQLLRRLARRFPSPPFHSST